MSNHIMITCPVMNVPVRTGYRAPPGSAIDGLKAIKRARCPECGGVHFWDGKDAFWIEYLIEPTLSRWGGFRERLRRALHVRA